MRIKHDGVSQESRNNQETWKLFKIVEWVRTVYLP